MTIGFHVSGCAYRGGPELFGRCGHMLWEQSQQCRPLEVSADAELFSQNGTGKETSGGSYHGDPRNWESRMSLIFIWRQRGQ